jgi:hypothetical protein
MTDGFLAPEAARCKGPPFPKGPTEMVLEFSTIRLLE